MKCDENIFKFCTADNWLNFHLFVLLAKVVEQCFVHRTVKQSPENEMVKAKTRGQQKGIKLWVVKNDLMIWLLFVLEC